MSTLDREVAREFGTQLAELLEPVLEEWPRDEVLESLGLIAFRRALEIAGEQDYGERGES